MKFRREQIGCYDMPSVMGAMNQELAAPFFLSCGCHADAFSHVSCHKDQEALILERAPIQAWVVGLQVTDSQARWQEFLNMGAAVVLESVGCAGSPSGIHHAREWYWSRYLARGRVVNGRPASLSGPRGFRQ